MRKRRIFIFMLVLCLLMLMSCKKSQDMTEQTMENVQEEEPESEPKPEPEPEEEPVFVEDTNKYGNTISNLHSGGMLTYDADGNDIYFYSIFDGRVVKTDAATGETTPVLEQLILNANFWEGSLYGINITDEGEFGDLVACNLETEELEIVREKPVDYLQIVNGDFYFIDIEDVYLRKIGAESGEEEILVEEPVHFPVVYKDIIVLQLDSDKESLYSIPKNGGEMVKLNDVHSYYPIVYHDRIYYNAMDEEGQYTLRSMKLDGSDDTVLAEAAVVQMHLHENRLYFIEEDKPEEILYMDLLEESEEKEIKKLDLTDSVSEFVKTEYGVEETQINYLEMQSAGKYIFILCSENIDGVDYQDEYIYQADTGEVQNVLEFCIPAEDSTEGSSGGKNDGNVAEGGDNTQGAGQESASKNTAGNSSSQSASGDASKDAEARAVAQAIADSIPAGSDLERVSAAASAVAGYCARATYTSDDPDYRTAYGPLCKGVYTCAGSTRALGMVLECMGYSWRHVNANQWTHQWCELTMDGQIGYADGMGGIAGYGTHPQAGGTQIEGTNGTVTIDPDTIIIYGTLY